MADTLQYLNIDLSSNIYAGTVAWSKGSKWLKFVWDPYVRQYFLDIPEENIFGIPLAVYFIYDLEYGLLVPLPTKEPSFGLTPDTIHNGVEIFVLEYEDIPSYPSNSKYKNTTE
ncbi:MAG: hypothetical protein ACRCW9_00960 [Cetobacterium sp.]